MFSFGYYYLSGFQERWNSFSLCSGRLCHLPSCLHSHLLERSAIDRMSYIGVGVPGLKLILVVSNVVLFVRLLSSLLGFITQFIVFHPVNLII